MTDGADDRRMLDDNGAAVVDIDNADAMRIADLGLRHRNERTGVADRLAVDGLRAMQMAKRNISDIRRKHVGRKGVFAADENPSFGPFRFERACDMKMAGDDERRRADFAPRAFDRLAIGLAHGAGAAASARYGQIHRARIRQREQMCANFAAGVADGRKMRAGVEGAVATRKGADRNDVRHLEQCARRFESRRRIMIAGDERDARMRTGDAQVAQCVVEQPLGVGGRIEAVKNVARHDDGVDRPLPGDGDKLRQRVAVLGFARPALQRRAKMPVGRVKKANHSGSRQQAVGRGQGPRLGAPGLPDE